MSIYEARSARRWLVLVALSALTMAVPALAAGPRAPPTPPVRPEEPAPPPYDAQLLRLSEILGALSYLNSICAADKGDLFRDRMQALIEAEATTPARRAEFAGAYNRGSRDLAATYVRCTDNARALTSRLRAEGAAIARQLHGKYGG